jgi:hypothetical protein
MTLRTSWGTCVFSMSNIERHTMAPDLKLLGAVTRMNERTDFESSMAFQSSDDSVALLK